MNRKDNETKKYLFYSCLIYCLFFGFLLFSLRSIYLSQDESFTYCLIHKSFGQITKLTAMDVHPFMYYFIAKIFITPFHNVFSQILSLRILSAIPYFILLILGNTTIRKHFGKQVSLLFMFSIITMPFLNKYMYIARMYSVAMLFTTLTFLVLVYIYKKFIPNSFGYSILLSVFSLLASYSHYFSLIACAVMYSIFIILLLFKRKKIRYLLLSAFIDIVFYLPWLIIVLFKQVQKAKETFWTTPLTMKNIIKSFIKVFSPIMDVSVNNDFKILNIIIVVLIAIIIITIFIHFREYKDSLISIGISVFLLTFISGIVLSGFIHHSILLPRFFTTTLGIFWFSIALFISDNEYLINLPKIFFTVAIVIFGIMSYSFNIYNLTNNNNLFRTTLCSIYKNIPKKSNVIYSSNAPSSSLSSYMKYDKNIVLTNKPNTMKLYNTVFNRYHISNLHLHNDSQYFFIISTNCNNHLDEQFYKKYKSKLQFKGNVYSPIDDNHRSILYKINLK